MTTNQIRLEELREQIRHNKETEEVQAKDAETRRKQFKFDRIMRPIEDVLDIVRAAIPSFKFSKSLNGVKEVPFNEKNLRAELARIKDLPAKEQVTNINNYITKQINYKGGRK